MNRQITSLVSKHEKHPLSEGPLNVFDSLMHSKLPPSEKTVQRLKGEGQILIGAGTLTTSNLLKVLFYHLHCRPDIFQKIRDEIDGEFPNPESPFELSRLESLPWFEASVKEALRLNYGVTHRLQLIAPQESLFFQEWEIPAGTPVGMTSVFMHDNPWVFPEPRCFKPERWMNPEIRPYLAQNFVPFSKGTRMCLGQHLAYAEIYLVSATLIRRYDMQLFEVSHDDIEMKHDFFDPYPKLDSKGLRVIMKRRD